MYVYFLSLPEFVIHENNFQSKSRDQDSDGKMNGSLFTIVTERM